jgi:hypothetical protein
MNATDVGDALTIALEYAAGRLETDNSGDLVGKFWM